MLPRRRHHDRLGSRRNRRGGPDPGDPPRPRPRRAFSRALFGGADYGGGIWDLLASGKLKREQRAAIEHAIGPIWEANHVWLVLVVVVLFTGFPAAFSAIASGLFVPLVLLVIGI